MVEIRRKMTQPHPLLAWYIEEWTLSLLAFAVKGPYVIWHLAFLVSPLFRLSWVSWVCYANAISEPTGSDKRYCRSGHLSWQS